MLWCCLCGASDSDDDDSLAVRGGAFPPSRRSTHSSSIPGAPPPPAMSADRRFLQEAARTRRKRDLKILLLGTGESGKSTILKQMKVIHQGGYSEEERAEFRADIFRNVVEGMQQILAGMRRLGVRFGESKPANPLAYGKDEHNATHVNWGDNTDADTTQRPPLAPHSRAERYARFIEGIDSTSLAHLDTLPADIVIAVKYLWEEAGLKYLFDRLIHVSYVIDSAPYFFDEIDRIGAPDGLYLPITADILRARTTTLGIAEMNFTGRFCNIKMIDVGGQRSERTRLWVTCFENVTSVIFCVALSEYDQGLAEDPTRNRLVESLHLFQDIINSRWFLHSSIVLFLNKTDVFARKLQTSPLVDYFPEYTGPNRFEEAAEFIRDRFLSLNTYRLQIYPYLTCATDTNNINMVFQAVEETVLANALRDTGIF